MTTLKRIPHPSWPLGNPVRKISRISEQISGLVLLQKRAAAFDLTD